MTLDDLHQPACYFVSLEIYEHAVELGVKLKIILILGLWIAITISLQLYRAMLFSKGQNSGGYLLISFAVGIQRRTTIRPPLAYPLANVHDVWDCCTDGDQSHIWPCLHPNNNNFKNSPSIVIEEVNLINLGLANAANFVPIRAVSFQLVWHDPSFCVSRNPISLV